MSRHIVLGVTGSIAAYKAAEIVRRLRSLEYEVSVVMTEAAAHFVGELTFRTLSRNPVTVGMFDACDEWYPEHISLAERGDVIVIAPCTANVIAKMANGIADDVLTCTVLAAKVPVLIAPAMNEGMWENPATVENVETLRRRGINVMDVDSGELACGTEGKGRMPDIDEIIKELERILEERK